MPALARLLSSRPLWLVVATLVALSAGDALLARLFWFEALGYDAVFWRILLLKAGLFLAAGLLAYAYAFVNLAVLRRQIGRAGASRLPASGPWTPVNLPAFPALRAWWLPAAAALAPAAVVGLVAAGSWDTVLRFVWAQPFGRTDPVFGHDLGFYLFSLPPSSWCRTCSPPPPWSRSSS